MGNNVTTLGISQPTNLEIKTLSSDTVLFDWDEPAKTGGSPILKYRLRISEKDNLGSPYFSTLLMTRLNLSLRHHAKCEAKTTL